MGDRINKYFKRKNKRDKVYENIRRILNNIIYIGVKYDDKKAKKYLDKSITKYIKYSCIDYNDSFIICDRNLALKTKSIPFFDLEYEYRPFGSQRFLDMFSSKIFNFLIEEYEISDYKKTIIENKNDWKAINERPITKYFYFSELTWDSMGVMFSRIN